MSEEQISYVECVSAFVLGMVFIFLMMITGGN